MDPARTFGQPAVRNVRTEILAEEYRAGSTREELTGLYELTLAQIDEAIRFELIAGRDRPHDEPVLAGVPCRRERFGAREDPSSTFKV